jgi:hypothetical protein
MRDLATLLSLSTSREQSTVIIPATFKAATPEGQTHQNLGFVYCSKLSLAKKRIF